MPLLARACLDALAAFPELNCRVDTDRQEFVRLPQVRLGFAAQTDHGLVVPVVLDAAGLTLDDLAAVRQGRDRIRPAQRQPPWRGSEYSPNGGS